MSSHVRLWAEKFLLSPSHSQFRAGNDASEFTWWWGWWGCVTKIGDYWERIWETDGLASDDPFRNVSHAAAWAG